LSGLICSQCCGEHRIVRIACHPNCAYLDTNSDYQEKRIGDRFRLERKEFYKALFESGGEKAAALFNLVEVVTFSYFSSRRDGQDGEVIAAVQALRRSLSPLHIPSGPPQVFAEQLKKEYDAFVKQQPSHGPQQMIDQQLAMEVLDRALDFVTSFSGNTLQSRRFLTGLTGYIRTHHPEIAQHLASRSPGSGRIILPGEFAQSPEPSPGHLHTGPHRHQH
jgi:hypothetical protein